MHLIVQIAAAIGITCSAFAQTTEEKAYSWLENQQQASGLLGNQESDNFAGLYPNALAAMAFIHQGDYQKAEAIFDFYSWRYATEFGAGSPGGFHQFADASTGTIDQSSDRWIGDNAWLLKALIYYRIKTGANYYDTMRNGIASWLMGLQDANGGVNAGYDSSGNLMNFYVTEGNLDVYAAFQWNPTEQTAVKSFLDSQMWVAADQRFKMGSTASDSSLDTCAWAVAALGPSYASTFNYTEQHFSRTDVSPNGQTIDGFADFIGESRIWLEGTGQMAIAYQVAGQPSDAAYYVAELEQAMVASQNWPSLVGLPTVTSDGDWVGADTRIFTASQVWYLFAKWGFNPLGDLSAI